MKKLSITFYALVFAFTINAYSANHPEPENENKSKSTAQKVADLLKKMSIEEKVGQMTQLTIGIFYKDGELIEDSLKHYIIKYNIGSLLNTDKQAITIEEWHELIRKIQDYSKKTRLKIPVLYGIDAIHGVTYTSNSTLFPHNLAVAATRNIEIGKLIAEITAKETRASGIRWNFDPVVGVGRDPLWPRFEETFGEDTYLVGEFGASLIKTYEGTDLKSPTSVASCIKHYLGYSMPANSMDRTPAYIPDILLREIFFPPFKKAVEAGGSTAMINSGSINGVPVHANKYLITDVLKGELGFKGLVVSDWFDVINLHKKHKITANYRESVKVSVNAGIDMSMTSEDIEFYEHLVDLVKAGEVSMERIDDAVGRILKVKFDVGLFDDPYPEKEAMENFNLPEYKKVALDAAHESVILLMNDTVDNTPILPLKKKSKVLVTGPGANALNTLHGSWSYIWMGDKEEIYPESTKTILEAIQNKIGTENVISVAPTGFKEVTDEEIEYVKANANKVDYIVLCIGEKSYAESAGNITDLMLPKDQLKLAKAALGTRQNVIIVLTEGRPMIVNDFVSHAEGVILANRPGSKGAEAIADILFGDYNPDGKLPYTYPSHPANPIHYDAPVRARAFYKPQWPFGYGLSYTTFEYGQIELNSKTLNNGETLDISIDITNTGNKDGKLGVDLFVSDLVASVIPAMKKLKRFTKIHLKAGETKTVKFSLTVKDLSFVAPDLKRITEKGDFRMQIGDKTAQFSYSGK